MSINNLQVIHFVHWPKSGITALIRDLVSHMARKDVCASIVLLEGDDSDKAYFNDADKVLVLNKGGFLSKASRFKRLIEEVQPDVIHVHSFTPLVMACLCPWNIPIISTVHSDYPYFLGTDLKSKLKRLVYRNFVKYRAVKTVAVADHIRALLARVLEVRKESLLTIANGIPDKVDNQDVTRASAQDYFGSEYTKTIIAVGRLSPEKNFLALIGAFSFIQHEFETVQLLIVGDGQQRKEIENYIKTLGLKDRVKLTGYQSSPSMFFDKADLLVCSSFHEGFPLVLLEGMRANIAIVSTPIEVSKQLKREHDCLCLSDGFSPNDIANSLRLVLSGKIRAEEVALKARLAFVHSYTIEGVSERYMKSYLDLVSKLVK